MKFGVRKLESWGNTGVWQTDGQTDRQTRCSRKDPRWHSVGRVKIVENQRYRRLKCLEYIKRSQNL